MQILAEPCRSKMAISLGQGVLGAPKPPPPPPQPLQLFQCMLNPHTPAGSLSLKWSLSVPQDACVCCTIGNSREVSPHQK